jgi:hypothetical protein
VQGRLLGGSRCRGPESLRSRSLRGRNERIGCGTARPTLDGKKAFECTLRNSTAPVYAGGLRRSQEASGRLSLAEQRACVPDYDGRDQHYPAGTELPAIRLHDLRHTCATILFMASKHPRFAQKTFGHVNIPITPGTYGHVVEGVDGGLADALDDAL